MLKLLKLLTASIALLSAVGCTSVQYKELTEMPVAQTDKGLVYFYRENKFLGAGVSYYIYEGEEESKVKLGALKNGTFFFVEPDPGKHVYWAKTESRDEAIIYVEAGKTYYVSGSVGMGIMAGRPQLDVVQENVGKPIIPGLKYTVIENEVASN